MSNVVIGIGLFVICTCCGVRLSSRYKNKLCFWVDFQEFNTLCSIRIPAYRDGVDDCLRLVKCGDFSAFAKQILTNKEMQPPLYLSKEESEYLSSYFHKVKTTDFQGVSVLFSEGREYALQKEKTARIFYEKNAKTCKKLGVLSGLMAFIFVV